MPRLTGRMKRLQLKFDFENLVAATTIWLFHLKMDGSQISDTIQRNYLKGNDQLLRINYGPIFLKDSG